MTDPYKGLPANIELNPPLAYSISSTTNASPIVVTTAAPHDLTPGDYVFVNGATDPGADGIWMVGTVTTNTVVLLVAPGGGNSTGTLAGGAAGTIMQVGIDIAYDLPTDTTDAMDASSVNVPLEELGDRTEFLAYAYMDGRQASTGLTTGTQLLDWSLGNHYVVGPITGNVTFNSGNPRPGQLYTVWVVQDGSGGNTVSWSAAFVFGSTYTSTVDGTANHYTIWMFRPLIPPGGTSAKLYCVGKEST